MLMQNLTWTDARELAKEDPVVIVPLGSFEQHGPHLSMWTDICLADEIARRVGERTGALVTPPLNFGYSQLWHSYPGTISLTSETFKVVLTEICSSLVRGGFRKIFLCNGHGPNLVVVQAVAYDVVNAFEDKDISIAAATYIFMAKEECDRIGDNCRDGTHANEMETAMMLALHPDLVKMDRIKDHVLPYKMRKVINFDQGACIVNRWPNSEVYSGVYGNPAAATAEKGAAYIDALVDKVSEFTVAFGEGVYDPHNSDGTARVFS